MKNIPSITKNYKIRYSTQDHFVSCYDYPKKFSLNHLLINDIVENFDRIKAVKSHISANDYFGTLATVLNLIIQEKNRIEERQNQVLEDLLDDLIYLQENYKIRRR